MTITKFIAKELVPLTYVKMPFFRRFFFFGKSLGEFYIKMIIGE
jgi:hypothetical protein